MRIIAPLCCLLPALSGAATEFRVSPFDANGLVVAQSKARAAAKRGPVTVVLESGIYILSEPLVFTASDSGTAASPVIWKAEPGATVRISGGRGVGHWQAASDPAVLSRLRPDVRPHVLVADLGGQSVTEYGTMRRHGFGQDNAPAPMELICRDRMMTAARHPNTGWITVLTATATGGKERFTFSDTGSARWPASAKSWAHGYWTYDWADTHDPLTGFDPAKGVAEIASPAGWYGVKSGGRFAFERILEALDAPGEYWVDERNRKLYFRPPEDEHGETPAEPGATVVTMLEAPLIQVRGASHLRFEGLTVEGGRGDGIIVTGGSNVRIAGCAVRNLGSRGIVVEGGRNHEVVACDVTGTGEGAIAVSGGDRIALTPARHLVANCHLHDYCRISRTYRPGVVVAGVGITVRNGWIHDAPHNAILLGGNDHLIERNRIERVCTDTGDAGAFYMGRDPTERGNVVRHNLFQDLKPALARTGEFMNVMAVYLDDTACGTRVEGNIVINAGWGLLIGGGHDNLADGNVFVDCDTAVVIDARATGWAKKYYDPGGGWEMERRLAAVPFTKPPWSVKYPALVTYSLATHARPKGIKVTNNVCIGGTWRVLNDGLTEQETGFKNNLVDDGSAGSSAPRWPAIPLDRIGLIRDAWRKDLPLVR